MIDYEKTIFNIDISSGNPKPGTLLISEPFLKEKYFDHAVIYLIEHASDDSSMGLVLNHRTGVSLSDIIPDIPASTGIPIYCGGPMSHDRLYYMHTLGDIITNAREISPGIFVGGNYSDMVQYVKSGYPIEGFVRFFIGYSGWSKHQLEEEVCNKIWAVEQNIDPATLLTGTGDSYWHRKVRDLGPDFRGWLFHPKNPQAN